MNINTHTHNKADQKRKRWKENTSQQALHQHRGTAWKCSNHDEHELLLMLPLLVLLEQ